VAAAIVVLLAVLAAAVPRVMPSEDAVAQKVAAGGIFASSYLALAIGKIPGLSIDRAGVALVGACLMIASGAVQLDDAYRAIDIDTITLLLGMMIIVANLPIRLFRTRDCLGYETRTPATHVTGGNHGYLRYIVGIPGE
jgi:di/tricarboxylate transporter